MSSYRSPEISLIMSVHNGERYIIRALSSVLSQTFFDFELILIDDGSSDRSFEYVSLFTDPRLRVYRQENMGLTKSLNKALGLAQGRYIARHDADDFSIFCRFHKQIEFLKNNQDIGMLGTSCFIQPERHNIINEVYDYPENNDEIKNAFTSYNPFVHGSVMARRELIEDLGGYNENYRYVQDYELWSRLLPRTNVHNLSVPLYVRSVHSSSSEVSVDKGPIFKEIRDNYIIANKYTGNCSDPKRTIRSVNVYPFFSNPNGWNSLISRTYKGMAKYLRERNLPNVAMRAQSYLYWPWSL